MCMGPGSSKDDVKQEGDADLGSGWQVAQGRHNILMA